MHKLGGKLVGEIINADSGGYQGRKISCKCGKQKEFEGYRKKSLQTVLSLIDEVERAYYHCKKCGSGSLPKDEYLDIVGTSFSPGVRKMMGLVGGDETFEKGKNFIQNLAGIDLTTKAVERGSEEIGAGIRQLEEQRISDLWSGKSIVVGSTTIPIMYIAMDGTCVPTLKEWREAKLGCVFTQTTTDKDGKAIRDDDSTSYCGAIEGAESFGRRIYTEAALRGIAGTKKVVVLGDGAKWIWNLSAEHFHGAIEIVDFYHASEHLWNLGKVIYGEHSSKTGIWVNARITDLEKGKIEAVTFSIKRLRPKNSEARQKIVNETGYFESNKERMRYSEFRKMGLFIGSGVVEAGCKNVIGRRLKQSGMKWSEEGADAIMALRMCQLSGKWENFWEDRKVTV